MDAQKQSFSGQKIKFKNLPTTMLALSCRGSSKISRFITQSTEGKEANFDWREWEDMNFIFWKFSSHSNLEVKKHES